MYKEIPNLKVSVSKELTKLHERNFYGNIKDVIDILKSDDKTTLGEYTFIIEKETEKKEETSLSIEAYLIDIIIKNNISLKEAIDKLNKESNFSKKDIYNASLNIKNKIG